MAASSQQKPGCVQISTPVSDQRVHRRLCLPVRQVGGGSWRRTTWGCCRIRRCQDTTAGSAWVSCVALLEWWGADAARRMCCRLSGGRWWCA